MLNPLLLWFLPLAAVPIVLHLVTLYRLRTVELSTYRFLMDTYTRQRRRVRLLEWLVLLLRAAFIALIVMVMARPVIKPLGFLGQSSTGRDVSVIVDTGPTTALRSGGTTALERQRSAAKTVLGQLGRDDYLRLIDAGAKPRMLTQGFADDKNLAGAKLNSLKPGSQPASLGKAIERALADQPQGPRYLYIVTDGRRASWQTLVGDPVLKRLDDQTQVVVLDVGANRSVANHAILGHAPANHEPLRGLPMRLRATVSARGKAMGAEAAPRGVSRVSERSTSGKRPSKPRPSPPRDSSSANAAGFTEPARAVDEVQTTLSVVLGKQTAKRLSLRLSGQVSSPDSKVTRVIGLTPDKAGDIRGRLELPADAYPADDVFRFALHVRPELAVTIVTHKTAHHDNEEAREEPALYLRSALRSSAQTTARQALTDQDRKLAKSISVNTVGANKLDDQALHQADVLVLADVPMTEKLGKKLAKFTTNGGGLLVMPGPEVNASDYNEKFFDRLWNPSANNDSGDKGAGALPIRFAKPVGDVDDESTFASIGRIRTDHPVLRAFTSTGQANKQTYFDTTRLFRYLPLKLGSTGKGPNTAGPGADGPASPSSGPRPSVRLLMRLADDTPILAEALGSTTFGWAGQTHGHLLIAGFSAAPAWSNLPLKPEFVPLMLRGVAYLRPQPDVEVPSVVEPGEPAKIRITDRWPDASVQALTPGGQRQSIALHRSGRDMVGALMHTRETGFYRFEVVANKSTAPDRIERSFAVNVSRAADALAPVSPQRVKRMLRPAQVSYVTGSPDDPVLAAQLTKKSEIWRTLIWVTFAVIAVEFLIATLRPSGGPSSNRLLSTTSRWTTDLYRTLLPGARHG